MTDEQITNLLDRGFTPDQITSLNISPAPTTGDAAADGAEADAEQQRRFDDALHPAPDLP